ncbi:MAG TPA: hypothetical protein VIN07_13295 [Flavipsychrobacter sp.]
MKRSLTWLICLCGLFIITGGDAFAQYSQTKCPPKKKSWKVRKSLIKFPELLEKEKEKERTAKEAKRAQAAKVKEDEKVVRKKQERKPLFNFERRNKARFQKLDNKELASTKCPH